MTAAATALTEGVVLLRDMLAADRPYILRTWIMSLAPHCGPLEDRQEYYRGQAKLCEDMVREGRVIVACLQDSPEVIVGFAVFDAEREQVHVLTTHAKWRGTGVSTDLLAAVSEIIGS